MLIKLLFFLEGTCAFAFLSLLIFFVFSFSTKIGFSIIIDFSAYDLIVCLRFFLLLMIGVGVKILLVVFFVFSFSSSTFFYYYYS
jgi:hypothetical protein